MTIRNQLEQLGLFDAKVPRYTSYPTSPHFGTDVGSADVVQWIERIPEKSEISLYVHIPFCRRLCWFCACRTQGTQSQAPIRAYLEVLKAEIATLAQHLPKGVTLQRLHWGGGTPTLLPADMIEELAAAIFAVTPLAEGSEFSVEIDPNEIDSARLDALAKAGMNRASIGVQDFDPEIQSCIGREQSYDVTKDAIDMIRARGVTSLNADILYGLPHQTKAKITESVQKLLSLNPDRVALYGYAHVPWMARRQSMIPSDALPTPQERLELFETARKLFLWDEYREIGIDHFATKTDGLTTARDNGTLRRNFQGYTEDTSEVLIGLGASSISRFPQGYAQNDASTSKYTAAVRAGQVPIARGHVFSDADRCNGRLIEALMCDFRISSAEMQSRFGMSGAELTELFNCINARFNGLLSVTKDGLFIPMEVRPLARIIAREFDAYDLSRAGHSSAI